MEILFLNAIVQCSTLIWALLLPSVDKSLYFYSSSHQSNETGIVKNIQNIVPHGISTVENMKKQLDNANSGEMAINESNVDRTIVPTFSVSTAFAQLATQFKTSYSNPAVIKWSIWWAIATCGYLQVTNLSIDDRELLNRNHWNIWFFELDSLLFTNTMEYSR